MGIDLRYDKIRLGDRSMDRNEEFIKWVNEIQKIHLPRWDELPELDLYMDQVVTLVERYLNPLIKPGVGKERILTKAMVNNYVKLQLIPAPIKKQYSKKHLAYLFVITVLKQVVTIKEIKQGVDYLVDIVGEKNAYNYFVEEQERAIHTVANSLLNRVEAPVDVPEEKSKLPLKMAVLSFATKIAAEKLIELNSNEIR